MKQPRYLSSKVEGKILSKFLLFFGLAFVVLIIIGFIVLQTKNKVALDQEFVLKPGEKVMIIDNYKRTYEVNYIEIQLLDIEEKSMDEKSKEICRQLNTCTSGFDYKAHLKIFGHNNKVVEVTLDMLANTNMPVLSTSSGSTERAASPILLELLELKQDYTKMIIKDPYQL